MEIIRNPKIMLDTCRGFAMKGASIGFVPTMGALHDGHLALIRASSVENTINVASIFVNPMQFGPQEDFAKYPRDMDADIAKLKQERVDILFMPDPASMYPKGFSSSIDVGDISTKLCGAYRPGHFDGVATVVAKLFIIVQPMRAYFGRKDYQQTLVIKRMAADLNIPTEVVVCPTVREADGIAMSSRNRYLSQEQRQGATVIYRTLTESAERLKSGQGPMEVSQWMQQALRAEPLVTEIQYAAAYDHETLVGLEEFKGRALLAVALKMGDTRLIDNVLI